MNLRSDPASRIALDLLSKSAGPLISGDFESFAACFHLPQALATPTGVRVLRNREDLQDMFEDLLRYYRGKGTTIVNRTLIQAEFWGEGGVISIHENLLIGRKGVIAPPIRQVSVLQKKHDSWRVSFCEYTPADDVDFCRALMGRPNGVPGPSLMSLADA